MRKPRNDLKPVLDGLSADQKRLLRRWMFHENVTFAEGQKRLLDEFGVKLSAQALCRWWHNNCKAAPEPPSRRLLLEVGIRRRKRGLTVRIYERFPGVAVKVNGKKLKPFTSRLLKEEERPENFP
jgi:hypothetical protein